MILTGPEITSRVKNGDIRIEPFDAGLAQPNSYDFHLGADIGTYTGHVLDCARDNPFEQHPIPAGGFELQPHRIYLAATRERIGSDLFVPIIRARSSIARLGLFVHVTADLIDLGSFGQLTLQLHAVQPVRIYPGMLIGQVTFWEATGERVLYDGKYQHSRGPQPSKAHLDIEAR
ncbi:dCTP deaminase [Streptomyces sp. Wh19]|uniref:dCTP deaminase n=1 Tax=Streptomyces sp. Wh19 TaxID=3076629 RepID=UPI002958DD11|nr:dCTP deaminase [Streptomyces sp. Wh19]MDV9194639.1 dCTP deaminase [Streptomyces sp. Wh19]